jgi:hypothetical protein
LSDFVSKVFEKQSNDEQSIKNEVASHQFFNRQAYFPSAAFIPSGKPTSTSDGTMLGRTPK